MKSHRINNIILALFLTANFMTPVMIKVAHRHSPTQAQFFLQSSGKTISAAERDCPICQFEFVSFISENFAQYFFQLPAKQLQESRLDSAEFQFSFVYYAHRAPPLS